MKCKFFFVVPSFLESYGSYALRQSIHHDLRLQGSIVYRGTFETIMEE
jgi:hypothetical protein